MILSWLIYKEWVIVKLSLLKPSVTEFFIIWKWFWSRLQNSPYFCVFKYARAVKQKVWSEALTPRFSNFFTDFEKKTGCFVIVARPVTSTWSRTNIASAYVKSSINWGKSFLRIFRHKNCTDTNLGVGVCISTSFHFTWVFFLDCVRVRTSSRAFNIHFWFSHDVTKFQTKELSTLLSFHFLEV